MSFIHFQNLGQILRTIPQCRLNYQVVVPCRRVWTWSFNFKSPARGVRAEKEDRKGGGVWLGGIGRGKNKIETKTNNETQFTGVRIQLTYLCSTILKHHYL